MKKLWNYLPLLGSREPPVPTLPSKDGNPVPSQLPLSFNEMVGFPLIYMAVDLVAGLLARAPIQVYNTQTNQRVSHPLNTMLRKPYRDMSGFDFWNYYYGRMLINGNGYCRIIRRRNAADSSPTELVPAINGSINRLVRSQSVRAEIYYNLSLLNVAAQRTNNLFPWQVLALNGPLFDGYTSPSPVRQIVRSALEQLHKIYGYTASNLDFGQEVMNALAINDDYMDYSPEQRDDFRAGYIRARDEIRGRKTTEPLILAPGLTLEEKNKVKASDLDMNNHTRWITLEVSRTYKIPPAQMFHFTDGQRVEPRLISKSQDFISSQADLVARVESELSDKLLSPVDKRRGLSIRLNMDNLAASTVQEKAEYTQSRIARGMTMTPNEGRVFHGDSPLPNPRYDELIIPVGAAGQENQPGNTEGAGEDNE